jgi:hypothetical protein
LALLMLWPIFVLLAKSERPSVHPSAPSRSQAVEGN